MAADFKKQRFSRAVPAQQSQGQGSSVLPRQAGSSGTGPRTKEAVELMRNRPLWIPTLSRQVHESSLATAEQLGRKQWAQTLITGVAAGLATVGIVAVGKAVLLGQWWKIGTLIFYAMVLI